jgi:peroxiredoxin
VRPAKKTKERVSMATGVQTGDKAPDFTLPSFTDAGAEVIGVSSDSVNRHAAFAGHHRLPFTLLSDEGGRVATGMTAERRTAPSPGRY